MFAIGGSHADQETGLSACSLESCDDIQEEGSKMPRTPVSIISNQAYLISIDPDICLLPNQIGDIYKVVDQSKSVHNTSKWVPTGLKGEGCDFNVPNSVANEIDDQLSYDREDKYGAGFLANIFINFEILEQHAKSAGTIQDFLSAITRDINTACGSVWSFQWRMLDEYPGFMTCTDQNFSWSGKIQALEVSVDSISSIVHSLSMQSQISNNLVNALYVAANGPNTEKTVKVGEMHTKNIIPLMIEFALDGISGIQYGTNFSVDYLPSRYRNQTYLFAKGVQHSVNSETWLTTVTAAFRWAPLEGGTLQKIRLKKIPDFIAAPTDTIRVQITEDATAASPNAAPEGIFGQEKTIPRGLFYSAESQNLTMGGNQAESIKGQNVGATKDKQATKEDQETALSKGLARIYNIGTNDSDVKELTAILKDILNKLPEDVGDVEVAEGKKYKRKSSKKRVVLTEKSNIFLQTKLISFAEFAAAKDNTNVYIPRDGFIDGTDIDP